MATIFKDKKALTKGGDQLTQLVREIREYHAKVISSAQVTIEHAHSVGKKLKEAKDLVGHGEWKTWVTDNCSFSIRTAQNYMRITSKWGKLEAKAPRTALLSIGRALDELAEPAVETKDNPDDGQTELKQEVAGLPAKKRAVPRKTKGDKASSVSEAIAGSEAESGDGSEEPVDVYRRLLEELPQQVELLDEHFDEVVGNGLEPSKAAEVLKKAISFFQKAALVEEETASLDDAVE